MEPSPVVQLNAFVPAKDLDVSKQFYSELGFTLVWSNDDIAQFQIGSSTFLLQKFYIQQHADNFMMALRVEDADAWWKHIETLGLKEKYKLHMVTPPTMQPRGIRVLYISDPTGVLWHIQDGKKA
jgi:catechol 2,3-dioxygenase-like lactoylglutathione lyase family enzyme